MTRGGCYSLVPRLFTPGNETVTLPHEHASTHWPTWAIRSFNAQEIVKVYKRKLKYSMCVLSGQRPVSAECITGAIGYI